MTFNTQIVHAGLNVFRQLRWVLNFIPYLRPRLMSIGSVSGSPTKPKLQATCFYLYIFSWLLSFEYHFYKSRSISDTLSVLHCPSRRYYTQDEVSFYCKFVSYHHFYHRGFGHCWLTPKNLLPNPKITKIFYPLLRYQASYYAIC